MIVLENWIIIAIGISFGCNMLFPVLRLGSMKELRNILIMRMAVLKKDLSPSKSITSKHIYT